jgi:hypothetical protein
VGRRSTHGVGFPGAPDGGSFRSSIGVTWPGGAVTAASITLHREVQGTVKTVTLKRVVEKWYVVLSCDLGDVAIEPGVNPAVGIDVGLKSFLSKSDGTEPEPNLRYLKSALPELRRKGRAVSRDSPDSPR